MKYLTIIALLTVAACGSSGPIPTGYQSSAPDQAHAVSKPPKTGGVPPRPSPPVSDDQPHICTRGGSDCGWQAFHPGAVIK